MSSFLQADIFFFITSIAVIVLTAMSLAVLISVLTITRRVNRVSRTIEEEVHHIKQDIDDLRDGVRDRLETVHRSPLTSLLGAIVSYGKRYIVRHQEDTDPPKKRRKTTTQKRTSRRSTSSETK